MTVTVTSGGTLITGAHIPIARLIALKGMVKLESLGIRKRGVNARKIVAAELGLDKRAGYDQLIGELAKRIEQMSKEAAL